jgi:hypothetical protein
MNQIDLSDKTEHALFPIPKPRQSSELDKIAEALSLAQGEFKNPRKDKTNTFRKSNYADLPAFLDACRPVLSKFGLSIVQRTLPTKPEILNLETVLLHTSGQWISGELTLALAKTDAQSVGSAMTYARRYSLQALLLLAGEGDDNDGEGADGRETTAKPTTGGVSLNATVPMAESDQIEKIKTLARSLGWTPEKLREVISKVGVSRLSELSHSDADGLLSKLEMLDAKKQAKENF